MKAFKKIRDIQNDVQCQESQDASQPAPLRIKKLTIKPINEFEKEVAWIVRAFPKLFPFGSCGWVNKNRMKMFEEFQAWV